MNFSLRDVLRPAVSLLPAAALLFVVSTGVGSPAASTVQAATDPAQPAFFTESVQPIFQANCYRCHGGLNHRGGLNMGTRELLLKGGHHGQAIVPGQPGQNLLLKLIRHESKEDGLNMPPTPRPKLSDADIATVETWIKAGAAMPPAP